jgi:hypothetical protein
VSVIECRPAAAFDVVDSRLQKPRFPRQGLMGEPLILTGPELRNHERHQFKVTQFESTLPSDPNPEVGHRPDQIRYADQNAVRSAEFLTLSAGKLAEKPPLLDRKVVISDRCKSGHRSYFIGLTRCEGVRYRAVPRPTKSRRREHDARSREGRLERSVARSCINGRLDIGALQRFAEDDAFRPGGDGGLEFRLEYLP